MSHSVKIKKGMHHTRLNIETLLFTERSHVNCASAASREATPISRKDLTAMAHQFKWNGGKTVELDGLLIMKDFIDCVLGDGSISSIRGEVNACLADESHAEHATFAEDSSTNPRVHALKNYPAIERAHNMACVWTSQWHPLVAQTGPSTREHITDRKVYWCVCINSCTLTHGSEDVSLQPGDIYVKAVQ